MKVVPMTTKKRRRTVATAIVIRLIWWSGGVVFCIVVYLCTQLHALFRSEISGAEFKIQPLGRHKSS